MSHARRALHPPRVAAAIALFLLASVIAISPVNAHPGPVGGRYAIDARSGSFTLAVKKKGLLSAFGHDHEMAAATFTGEVLWLPEEPERSSVTIRVPTGQIDVRDADISDSDRDSIRDSMRGAEVLDAARFPEIAFVSRSVVARAARDDGARPLSITGDLSIHGVTRTATIEVVLREQDGAITVDGGYPVSQADFGIEPPSAVLGTIGVEDVVDVRFRIVARLAQSGEKKP